MAETKSFVVVPEGKCEWSEYFKGDRFQNIPLWWRWGDGEMWRWGEEGEVAVILQ